MKICLVAIVKNSGLVWRDSLRSFLPFVDSYCICDTGSTDDTINITKQELVSLPGYLFEEKFIHFSHNRNRVLEEAEKHCPSDYYLMIDDSFFLIHGERMRPFIIDNPVLYYCFSVQNEETTYLSGRITTRGMRYKYRVHESVDTTDVPVFIPETFIIEKRPTDHIKRSLNRTTFDLIHLKRDLMDYPDDPRMLFYLARTLYQNGQDKEAIRNFEKRILLEGNEYEVYMSMIYVTIIHEQEVVKNNTSWEPIIKRYLDIHERFPSRAEPLFFASLIYQKNNQDKEAISCLEKAVQIPITDKLGVKHHIYHTHIPKLLTSYYFKTNVSDCVRLIMHFYILPKHEFDFLVESYIRFIFRFQPTVMYEKQVIMYHPTGKYNATFSEHTLAEYINTVSYYQINDLFVCNRIDRIPYFPSIQRIHIVLDTDLPEGNIEHFPMIQTIFCQDEEHKRFLTKLMPNAIIEPKSKCTIWSFT
jgi:tetratricopeptide (TPR) repeat protein